MTLLNDILPFDFINALGWTILHSSWQILGIAGLLALVQLILKKSESNLRYLTATIALSLILICSFFTLIYEYQNLSIYSATTPSIEFKNIQQPSINPINNSEVNYSNMDESLIINSQKFLQRNIDVFVFLWMTGVMIYFFRFFGGFLFLHRLKSKNSSILSELWEKKITYLCEKMKIKKPVRALQSSNIKTPLVIGYFKPIIILPISLFTGLPTNQIETIIIHELAHIYRKDYLVNILQSIIEILYFYHPAIWWISRTMQLEREKCCDDIVLKHTNASTDYIKALSNLATTENAFSNTALAFSSTKNALLKRIQHIVKQSDRGSVNYSGLLSSVLIIITLFAFAFAIASNESFTNQKYSNEWWYPIAKKHDIPKGAFSNFLNVFEAGETNQINEENRTTINATVIINQKKDYIIVKSSKAIFTYNDSTYRFNDAILNRYSKTDSSIKSKEKVICNNLEIKFIKDEKGLVSYLIINLDYPQKTNSQTKWMPVNYSRDKEHYFLKNLLKGEWYSDFLSIRDTITIAENITIKTWHGVEIEAKSLIINLKQGKFDTEFFRFLIMNNKVIINFNKNAKDKFSYSANEIYKEGRFIRLLGDANFLSDELTLKANEIIIDITGSE